MAHFWRWSLVCKSRYSLRGNAAVGAPRALRKLGDAGLSVNAHSACAAGGFGEVMDVLEKSTVSASKDLYAQTILKCGQTRSLSNAKRLHKHLVERRLESDFYLGSGIVEMYVKCGSLVDAVCVHMRLPHRNEFSWTALISGYANSGQGRQALRIYEEMLEEGVKGSRYTFLPVLKACGSLGDLETGKKIHGHMIECGLVSDVYVATTLVDMYAKCGSMVDARHAFDKLAHRDVVSWTAMILGHAQKEEGESALELYAQMRKEGVTPDDRTFVGTLKACGILAALEEGTEVDGKLVKFRCLEKGRATHSQVVKGGFESDVFVGTTLVDMYVKCGSMVDARHVFEKLPHRNVVSWNAVILGYVEQGESEEAFKLYAQMLQQGLSPDSVTFVSILRACANSTALRTGREMHALMCKVGLETRDVMVATALVDMYAKCGSMVDARHLFDAMATREVVTWNALIAGYGRQGQSELVFRIFDRMMQEGIQPDGVTFLSLLTVCSHVGLVDKAQKYFEAMAKDHGITPSIEHYSCMVDLFGRGGQVEKAVALVKAMPLEADLVIWLSILSACRKFKNVEVGRYAFECAVRVDEKQASAYVLMSNIYADVHRWEDRDNIQAMKKKAGAWKEAGQSWWIDGNGMAHTFMVGDTRHPRSKDIHAKLKSLSKAEKHGMCD